MTPAEDRRSAIMREAHTCVPHGRLDCPECIAALDELVSVPPKPERKLPPDGGRWDPEYVRRNRERCEREAKEADARARASRARHYPRRGDDVEAWLKRARDHYNEDWQAGEFLAVDRLLDRYRECSDYGLTLRPEDDERGDP